MASTFDQRYPSFLVGQSTQDLAVGTLLPIFSTLEKWSRAGTFGTHHELERDLKNSRTQLPAEIRLEPRGIMQSLARTLLESSYDFTMTLLIHTDANINIMLCQGF